MERRAALTPSGQVAVLAVLACAVLAVAALAGDRPVTWAVAAAAAVLAWGWPGALGLPAPRGSAVVLALGGAGLVVAVSTVAEASAWGLTVALGLSVVAALVHQLLRRDGRPRLVESVASVVLGLAVVAAGAAWVTTTRIAPAVVVAGAGAVAVSAVVDVLGRWPALRPWTVPLGMLAGAGAAAGLAATLADPPAYPAAVVLGVVAAAVSQAVRATFSGLPTLAHARPRLVSALSSVLLAGAAGYAVASVLY